MQPAALDAEWIWTLDTAARLLADRRLVVPAVDLEKIENALRRHALGWQLAVKG